MVKVPTKALKESDFTFPDKSEVKEGSHQIDKVTFVENNITKKGFYKRLTKTKYPSVSGKFCVADSLFSRLFLGERASEERLVYDNYGNLVGTLSIAIEGFKPFNYWRDSIPTNEDEKEEVVPSTDTLLKNNIIEILFERWFLGDDDAHPKNIGKKGSIDRDMYHWWILVLIKGERKGVGIPNTRVNLTVSDWENFPNAKDAKIYHWPTHNHPGKDSIPNLFGAVQEKALEIVLPKSYEDPVQFARLASIAKAHDQKFEAALKALLTFQPDLVRNELTNLFGDERLDYTSLDEYRKTRLEKNFPELFNSKTDQGTFVDFIMKVYQLHYDALYRLVVYYMGCDQNNYGVKLFPTYKTLYHTPSFFQKILEWVKNEKHIIYPNDEHNLKFIEEAITQRYHEVFRDSIAPKFKESLHRTHKLADTLFYTSSDKCRLDAILDIEINDEKLTDSWQYFGTYPNLSRDTINSKITVQTDSNLRNGLLLLVDFTKSYQQIVKKYYEIKYTELTIVDNQNFTNQLTGLLKEYDVEIVKSLGHTSTYAKEFSRIVVEIDQLIRIANFEKHLLSTDEVMKQDNNLSSQEVDLAIDSKEIKNRFNKTLFDWVNTLSKEEFDKYICEIMKVYYRTYISDRSPSVNAYLELSNKLSGLSNDKRLAFILCSGNEFGDLDKSLIQYLTPIMLQTQFIPSLDKAMRAKTFEKYVPTLTSSAVQFAKNDKRFNHLYHADGVEQMSSTLFEWIGTLSKKEFNELVEIAIKKYESNLSYVNKFLFGKKSRRDEVEEYLNNEEFTNEKVVAFIFTKSNDGSTMRSNLFDTILDKMMKSKKFKIEHFESFKDEIRMVTSNDECKFKKLMDAVKNKLDNFDGFKSEVKTIMDGDETKSNKIIQAARRQIGSFCSIKSELKIVIDNDSKKYNELFESVKTQSVKFTHEQKKKHGALELH